MARRFRKFDGRVFSVWNVFEWVLTADVFILSFLDLCKIFDFLMIFGAEFETQKNTFETIKDIKFNLLKVPDSDHYRKTS